MKHLLKSNRGEGYIDVVVLVLCAMLVIALAVKVFPAYIIKQQVDTFAVELMREAEIAGRVGTETTQRELILREKIESELPRFVATITQELKASRDVLGILENFKKNAGDEFGNELDILTADMRSSSYEAALTRFEARINSPMLSDITRGLIGVLRGDEGGVYFQMLAHDMKQLELQRLKAQAMKIPPKIRVFSFIMLMCFLMTYMAIIVYEILRSLGGMF